MLPSNSWVTWHGLISPVWLTAQLANTVRLSQFGPCGVQCPNLGSPDLSIVSGSFKELLDFKLTFFDRKIFPVVRDGE